MTGRKATKTRGSVTHPDPEEEDALFKLSFVEALGDEQVVAKLAAIMRKGTKDLVDTVSSLLDEVRGLKSALAERDAAIDGLRSEIGELRLQNDALEQYDRRSSLRISGISERDEDTAAAVVTLANDILKVEPPLQEKDIDVSHRLPKPRSAGEDDPRPVIVRFMTRKDRYRVISQRKQLWKYNKDNGTHIYVNEDLTTFRAKLFRTVRQLLAQKHFNRAWTFNGNIKVTTLKNEVKSISTLDDVKRILPNVNTARFI